MIKSTGHDKFGKEFDSFEWSAPYYETPEEVALALATLSIKGKRVKAINVIGSKQYAGRYDKRILYDRIHAAGRTN